MKWITWWIIIYIKIQDYFECMLKKRGEKTVNPSIIIHVKKIESRIMFKIKIGYYLKLFNSWKMKLHGITKSKITKNENGENTPNLKITDIVLIHCNIVYWLSPGFKCVVYICSW